MNRTLSGTFAPFPYILRDEGFISTYGKSDPKVLMPGKYEVYLTDVFPTDPVGLILEIPRLIACWRKKRRGILVACIEPESVALLRGWTHGSGMQN